MPRIRDLFRRSPLYPFLRVLWHKLRPRSLNEQIEIRDACATDRILSRLLHYNDNCVDVGAHRGDLLTVFLRYAPQGRHIAIEPIPELAAELRSRFPDVEVYQAAATDASGEVSFRIVRTALAFSGIERRPDLPPDSIVDQVTVPAIRLDDVIPPDRPVRLIKVDVEGAELLVLRGARGVLNRYRPWILFEHGYAAAAYGTTTIDLFAELGQHDLMVWTLTGWLNGEPALDCEAFQNAIASGLYWNFLAGPRS